MNCDYNDFISRYKNNCGTCEHLNIASIDSNGKCYCNKRSRSLRFSHKESSCGYYSFRKDKGVLKNYHEQIYRIYNPSACYITTAMVHILGFDDKCLELETLRNFRKNILQNNCEYEKILAEYDIIGPIISHELIHSDLSAELSTIMYTKYIVPVINFINMNEIENAVNLYSNMVKYFQKLLQIDSATEEQINLYLKEVKPEERGKAHANGYQRIIKPIN